MAVKQNVFKRLDAVSKRGAILATNTSTLDVDQIAAATARPQDVIGTHFFSPANVMRLLEIVRGRQTSNDVLATVMQLAKRLKKVGVVSRVCDGFIGNRMLEQYLRQSMFLVDEGASPQQVDAAMVRFGMAMGPFAVGDLAGLDIGYAIRQRRYVEKPHVTYSRVGDRVVELGRLGQKTGKGWYRYEAGDRTARPDPAIDELVTQYRNEIGMTPRTITDDEIVQRCVYALVNEGARILEEGIALRASDIDVVYLTGYGFPAAKGGPMFYAQTVGLKNVVDSMRAFAQNDHADPKFWQPAKLLQEAAAGRQVAALGFDRNLAMPLRKAIRLDRQDRVDHRRLARTRIADRRSARRDGCATRPVCAQDGRIADGERKSQSEGRRRAPDCSRLVEPG